MRIRSLLVFPDFNWWRYFWYQWLVFYDWWESYLRSFATNEQIRQVVTKFFGSNWVKRIVGLKWFLKKAKIFSDGHFSEAGFKVDCCLLTWKKSLSSSLFIAGWLILATFISRYYFFKNVSHRVWLFPEFFIVFDVNNR